MKYRNIIIALGFLIIVLPLFGFPQSWRNSFSIASGVLVVAFGYLSGKDKRVNKSKPSASVNATAPQSASAETPASVPTTNIQS